jgi:hypothetical protein
MPRLNGQPGTYAANEGIWLDRITGELAATAQTDAPTSSGVQAASLDRLNVEGEQRLDTDGGLA